ncbi:hypothetical protein GOPIP_081_00370 [Gordonia polyisoprenivorans NBRC 16320 = JCM 10675]|uniref:Uncharacterized protein n=1 Tax=Gordonia polyisoprenivorans TaxID=84595 RepID=A0A846WGH3_9ACTN|nr:hypothetical protein [Gordonia polyisoprenivorans]NKY00588.1 hypothetical protein [Gordonia polyisoprenivorans]GAB25398.1 hypothetical protein GOPIP_081_00370 [Gordonia polyisoprenivorans NBRC 16320 = JCM 10675]
MPPEHPRSHEHPDDRHGSDSTEEQEPPVLDSEARLRALVDRHIGEAIRECRSIDHEIARAIAAAMHDLTAPACQDQLLRFILLGAEGAPQLREELLHQLDGGDLPDPLPRWACWLLLHHAHADPALSEQLPTDGDGLHVYLTHIRPDMPEPGDTDQRLVDFAAIYRGGFPDAEAVVRGMSPLDDWETAIYAVADEHGCRDYVRFDETALIQHIINSWDVIPDAGRYHVFD